MQKRNLEVCLTPALLHLHDFSNSIVVVIDIFRATSSICYGIENGAESIIPVATIEACESYRNSDYLLAAERNGEVVDGFDFGNSPFSYTEDKVNGKTIVLTTTNGTHAINMSRGAHKIIIGSFLNLASLCDWLKNQPNDILLLCSGWKDKVNLEDTLFAGGVVHYLREDNYALDDAGIASEDLYIMAKDDLNTYLKKTSHSERLKKLGIEEDIKFCLNLNITKEIPVLDGERLIKMVI
ncbi:MAG: 2-phosphosulfolactate phosphatase [Daejeonella sp.]|uniref:2-phosphosulfolactate phosphatase n=1 Tax=Daejeonella sp. TaxID=2805397 RepID=UPI0027369E8B|nr:2-phosphosulfolactate phosphatase [Daejeonella sp.]MDP3469532.1 2-phosphosulfolactate phosphatase [Daejeonella sp.]